MKRLLFLVLLFVLGCSVAKEEYITIDDEVFSCKLVNNWVVSKNMPDGMEFQDADKTWLRFEPTNDQGSIGIRLYKDYSDRTFQRTTAGEHFDDIKYTDQKYHCKYQLGSLNNEEPYMCESWIFIKDKNMVELYYIYKDSFSEDILAKGYKEIKTTLESMKMK